MKSRMLAKFLSIVLMFVFVISISAQTFAATQSDKDQLQDQINQAKNDLNDISDSKDTASSELESLTIQVSNAENELAQIKAQLSEVNDEIATKEKEIKEEEEEIKAKDELLRQRMVALYEAGDTSYLDVLFNSEDLLDFISGYSAIQTILEADTKLINELEAKKEQMEQDKAKLEEDKRKVQNLKNEQEIKNATLLSLKENKQKEINKLTAAEQETQQKIDEYNAAMVKVNQELEEAAKKAQQQINSANGGTGLKFDGTFIWPCNNKTVTSGMKKRWGRLHKGIDIAATYENVYASASGYAYNAYDKNGYGTYIMVFHGGGYVTLYGHLSSSKVSNGQYVSQGEIIATSGNSGSSQGAHLHFEIRQASSITQFFSKSPLNPLDYLPGGWTSTAGAFTES